MTTMKRLVVPVLVLSLSGAGCVKLPQIVPVPSADRRPQTEGIKPSQGFGKLPALVQVSAEGATADVSVNRSVSEGQQGVSVGADLVSAQGSAPSGAGIATPAMPIRPPVSYPYPQPQQVLVKYVIEGAMPTWGTEDAVLRSALELPGASSVRPLAESSGLPRELAGSITTLSSVNIGWEDADAYSWSLNVGSGYRNLNVWYQDGATQPAREIKNRTKDVEVIAAADRFLDSHGFSAIRAIGGKIQDQPQILPMMKGGVAVESMPCVYGGTEASVDRSVSVGANGPFAQGQGSAPSAGIAVSDVAPAIYPNPCGWWPQVATVIYPMSRDGKAVMDAYGNEQQAASISVSLQDGTVSNGNIVMEDPVERSHYPLIDAKTAEQYLMSGGRNPVYPWSENGKNITVHLTKLELAWMRVDNWKGTSVETYWIPALRASGTIDRGVKGQEAEAYQTIIPLVESTLFQDEQPYPYPVPMMGAPTPASAPTKAQ